MTDIDEIRDREIKGFGLSKADERYTFYHDETNNIKKLHLSAQGLNVAEPGIFVLGGVVHSGAPRALDIQPLRNAMRVQKSADEIKLKHVAKGDFLDLLKHDNLTAFLKWISDSGLVIHYHALDPLYWSIVDIVDSIIFGLNNDTLTGLVPILKADLATLLRADLRATTNIFFRYNYPDLAPESGRPFLNELLELLERCESVLPHFNMMMLKGILQMGRDLPNLDFIEGYTPHVLIENFGPSYLERIAIFKHSTHIFDIEGTIRGQVTAMRPSSNGIPATHYRFTDSKSEPGIQVSDIVVGLIGKMHTYFAQNLREDVSQDRESLTGVSLRNSELLRDLIDASHDTNIAFLHHVSSMGDIDKMNLFLRTSGSHYEHLSP